MAVCQYFLRGQCRFGDACRNQHPQQGQGPTTFSNQTWTSAGSAPSKPILPFTQDSIKNDLTSEKPMWPLSTYGPAKHEPNLIAGLDESVEELRVRAFTALKAGNVSEYTSYEANKIAVAERTLNNARTSISEVFQTAAKQSPHAPKPITTTAAATPATTSPFGITTSTPASAFGAPSAFGQPAFGQSPFGATSGSTTTTTAQQPTSSLAFGQPAQAPTSAFGAATSQPQNPTATTASSGVFGQSSFGQQTTQPAFGQSSLIKPSSGAFSAFANAGPSPFSSAVAANNSGSGPTNTAGGGGGFSAFAGQASAFGSGNGFGQPTNTATPTAGFGQPLNQPQTSAFGTPTSGTTSAFGASASGLASAFGTTPQTAQPASAFGGGSGGSGGGGNASAFSAFGGSQTQPSPFGTTTNPSFGTNPSSPFGQGGNAFTGVGAGSAFNPLGAAIQSSTNSVFKPLSSPHSLNPITNSSSSSFGKTTMATPILDFSSAKGKYKPGSTPYDQLLPAGYAGMIPSVALEAFKAQKFEWGKVPDWIPPIEFR